MKLKILESNRSGWSEYYKPNMTENGVIETSYSHHR